MTAKIVKYYSLLLTGFLAAALLWAWMPVVFGLIIISDWNADQITDSLVNSISRVKWGIQIFVYLLVPALLIHIFVTRKYDFFVAAATWFVIIVLASSIYAVRYFIFPLNLQLFFHILAGAMSAMLIIGMEHFVLHGRRFETASRLKFSALRRATLLGAGSMGGLAIAGSLVPIVNVLSKSSRFVDIDVSKMQIGQKLAIEIGGLPVWIIKRSPEIIMKLSKNNIILLDQNSEHSNQPQETRNSLRSINPIYFIVYGICTHLGCSPAYKPNGYQLESQRHSSEPQFFCPCHGAVFDLAGRVYKDMPAERNMDIPNYKFIDEKIIRINYPGLKEIWVRSN